MESRIRNLSKQIDTEKRDRQEDLRRGDVSDDADERDGIVADASIQRKESVRKNAGVTIQGFVTVGD